MPVPIGIYFEPIHEEKRKKRNNVDKLVQGYARHGISSGYIQYGDHMSDTQARVMMRREGEGKSK